MHLHMSYVHALVLCIHEDVEHMVVHGSSAHGGPWIECTCGLGCLPLENIAVLWKLRMMPRMLPCIRN